VETVPERLQPGAEAAEAISLDAPTAGSAPVDEPTITGECATVASRLRAPVRTPTRRRHRVAAAARQEVLWVAVVYLSTRAVLMLAAYLLSAFGHHNFLHELANWDGLWYRELANHGYPNYSSHLQTTLGFFPLFPVTIWTLEPVFSVTTGHNAIWASTVAGVVISMIGGFIATLMVYRLATGWWGKASARRATILFVLFPGSVVFSMVYSEGLLLPLAAGCIYALERRRWLLAGILAGLATAVQPTGLVLIPVCALSAGLELRRQGWRLGDLPVLLTPAGERARRVLAAPALSCVGVGLFALFLWLWTGTPFANYQAQHHGWGEKTDFLALVHLTTTLANQISFSHFNQPTINLNLVVGLVGALLLGGMLVLMFRARRTISPEAILWTLLISFLAVTSEYVPPNPRMLITAFPALMVTAHYTRGKWFTWLAWANGVALVVLSLLTFYGLTLRP
jgi:hypothetical protein